MVRFLLTVEIQVTEANLLLDRELLLFVGERVGVSGPVGC